MTQNVKSGSGDREFSVRRANLPDVYCIVSHRDVFDDLN